MGGGLFEIAQLTAGIPPSPLPHPPTLDTLIGGFDRVLRTLAGVHTPSDRPYPGAAIAETVTAPEERRRIAALMRINHAGEIAAQALYHGQAVTARHHATREKLKHAAKEEGDHLAWCATRISELGGRTSLLDPLWYCGSFAIGAIAGAMGDEASLGFVAETERQVVEHLESHLEQLPATDDRTRAIVEQMRNDEARHGDAALNAGGQPLPLPVRGLMRLTAKVMTTTASWL